MGEIVNGLNTAGGAFVTWAGHMLLQSSVLIVILAALDLVLRKRVKAVVRYGIWLLVLAKLLLPPSLSSPTSPISWMGNRLPQTTPVSVAPDSPVVTPEIVVAEAPVRPAEGPASRPEPASLSALAAPTRPVALPTWQALALLAWMVASLVMAVLLLQRIAFVHGLMAQAREAPDALRTLLEQCRRQMGVRGKAGIRLSGLSASPCVCGLWRPVILVPEPMIRRLGTPGLRSVLLHELAHLRRGDLWINLLQTLLQIAYLYHPLLWWANARIRAVREQAVDETVLAALGEEAEEYPETLLRLSKLAFGQPALSLRLLGVVESEKALIARIEHMVSRPFPKSAKLGWAGLVSVLIVGASLLPMANAAPGRAKTEGVLPAASEITEAGAVTPPSRIEVNRSEQTASESGAFRLSPRHEADGVGTTPTALTAPPAASEAKIVLAPLDAKARLVPAQEGRVPFGKLPTASLNAWVKLVVLEQRVLVLETQKAFSDNWNLARHKVVGVWSAKDTLDHLQGRLKDGKSLPIRLHLFFLPELKDAAEDLREKIRTLAREAQADTETEIRMEPSTWMGSGESPFYVREGKIRTFYPCSQPRPDGGPRWLTSGLVDPNDLEQHILWRLTMPKNVPLTFRIEYDEASYPVAKQLANTARAAVKREGLTDLVQVAGTLVEPVAESALLGKWQARGNAVIQSVDVQPGGMCQVLVGEGSPVVQAGTRVKVPWVWTVREIQFDIGDPVLGRKGYPPYIYRASLNEDGNLVIQRGEIYPQGSFMHTRPPQMILQRVRYRVQHK